jgi:uncharacterized RDD family membrane protein YckC
MKPELEDTLAAAASSPDRTASLDGKPRPPLPPGHGLVEGQQLGHFRVESMLGAGGMGEVYLATDLALDRPVAIKVLPEALARESSKRDRLVREARAQARVVHPNVGHIYFIGEDGGRLYVAMEYVAGKTLTEKLAAGPLAVDEALGVIRAAALGLREAQRTGFTHRDVKPSNLMVDVHGVVKVLDFGLAAGDAGATSDGPVAQTSLAGTPLYMAPEQGRGEAVDFRADIYALGATLYHLVSGAPPFQADSADKLMTMHASAARPSVPRGKRSRTRIAAVETLVTKMMAPKPEDRFASYDELLDAIEIASAEHTHPAGFWARSIAASIDMLLVTMVCGFGITALEWISGWELRDNTLVVWPVLVIYQTLCLARWGKTIGKSLFELEVVSVHTQRKPTWKSAAIRSLVMFGWQYGLMVAATVVDMLDLSLEKTILTVAVGLSFVALAFVLTWAALRTPGKRALWDRVSGTIVRYHTPRPASTT